MSTFKTEFLVHVFTLFPSRLSARFPSGPLLLPVTLLLPFPIVFVDKEKANYKLNIHPIFTRFFVFSF